MIRKMALLLSVVCMVSVVGCSDTGKKSSTDKSSTVSQSDAEKKEGSQVKEDQQNQVQSLARTIAPDDKSYFFGISPAASHIIPLREWERYKESGIKSLRIHLQKSQPWTYYDTLLEKCAKEGIEVMMLVSYETYASESEPLDLGWGPIMHFTNGMKLVDTLAEAVPHFRDKGVTSWEIWNEENGMWHLYPEEYAKLITTVYEKFKYTDKWDENATVVFGGLDAVNVWFPQGVNGAAQGWVNRFYNSEPYKAFKEKYGRSPFDALGIHPYNTIDIDEKLEPNLNDFKTAIEGVVLNTMKQNGDEKIPIWITELGDQDADDDRNAKKLELYMKTAYAMPQITRFHWFKYTFVGSNYSIVREDGTPRKSFYKYQEVIKELTGK